ncbi:hypothetical protein ACS0TY_029182 [Phlomoides rotata]
MIHLNFSSTGHSVIFIWVTFHFVLYLLNRASDKCQKEKMKTINGDDLMWAMATLGFEDYIAPLRSIWLGTERYEKLPYHIWFCFSFLFSSYFPLFSP